VTGALEGAIGLQKALGPRAGARVGINATESSEGADEVEEASYLAVQTADQAGVGQIFVTDLVRQLVAGKGFVFEDRSAGNSDSEDIRLYELKWEQTG
jgi:hypothetical protein